MILLDSIECSIFQIMNLLDSIDSRTFQKINVLDLISSQIIYQHLLNLNILPFY